MNRSSVLALILCAFCSSVACDSEDLIRDYFSRESLHQVSAPTESSITLGQVFLEHDGKKSDALRNMFDNYGQAGWVASNATIIDNDRMTLPLLAENTVIEPSLGIELFSGLLQVNPFGNVKIESSFRISSIVARARIMGGVDVDNYLDSSASERFRRYLNENVHRYDEDARVTVVYKVLRTNQISITATEEKNISSDLTVTTPAVSAAAGYKVKKTSESTLQIDGDIVYVFAVGVLLLVPEEDVPLGYRVSYAGLRPDNPIVVDRVATSVTGGDSFEPLDDFVPLSELGLQ